MLCEWNCKRLRVSRAKDTRVNEDFSVSSQNPCRVHSDFLKLITGVGDQWKRMLIENRLCRCLVIRSPLTSWQYIPGFVYIHLPYSECWFTGLHFLHLCHQLYTPPSHLTCLPLPFLVFTLCCLFSSTMCSSFLKTFVFALLDHCIFPKDFWNYSLNCMISFFEQDSLFSHILELFHLSLLVLCFFKIPCSSYSSI